MTADSANVAQVLSVVDAIIDDFGNHRRDAYFARFSPDATFVFHTVPRRLDSRKAYEELWDEWEASSGFRVHDCTSTDRHIQVFGNAAVFSHDVTSVVEVDGLTDTVFERESIVLEKRDGVWLCVHEHLSQRPGS
ncbi:DUF4440 domain-containing protein [Cryobacterium sp. Sr8]|uniref:YybH family protein n=1 Tax=Cryobacterium sp. Sr8 TaxID=1259203 RepID=UPI00106AECAF|nr:nuclear transport factor 2 family protein [Cryobacterium sp. Sr8]TFD75270.1 DUF4440 domain-containing protein [Cryobacterium sp. Sr8]